MKFLSGGFRWTVVWRRGLAVMVTVVEVSIRRDETRGVVKGCDGAGQLQRGAPRRPSQASGRQLNREFCRAIEVEEQKVEPSKSGNGDSLGTKRVAGAALCAGPARCRHASQRRPWKANHPTPAKLALVWLQIFAWVVALEQMMRWAVWDALGSVGGSLFPGVSVARPSGWQRCQSRTGARARPRGQSRPRSVEAGTGDPAVCAICFAAQGIGDVRAGLAAENALS